jgi:hypothetical protein
MQIEGRRLYVSEPGGFKDQAGGIEAVDLDTLEPLGLVYTEKQMGVAQMSGFVFVSPERGYVVHHTDFAESSHLVSFSRITGGFIAENHMTFGTIERVAYDASTGYLYFADLGVGWGIRVFDAATGDQLTTASIPTGFPPVDWIVVRTEGTGVEPQVLAPGRITWASPNPTRGTTRIEVLGNATTGRLTLVDATGARIRTMLGEAGTGGAVFHWDGRDDGGARVPAGVYFYRAESGATGRVVVVR